MLGACYHTLLTTVQQLSISAIRCIRGIGSNTTSIASWLSCKVLYDGVKCHIYTLRCEVSYKLGCRGHNPASIALIYLIEVPLWPPLPPRFACTFLGFCGGRKRVVNLLADIEAHCSGSRVTEKPWINACSLSPFVL